MIGSDAFYADLDPGIRFAVKVLHAHGVNTCQSCEGGPGHSYPAPTVDMVGGSSEQPAFAALHHLETYGLEVCSIAQVWNVSHGRIHEVIWRVELRRPYPERADEWPMFVWSSSYLERGGNDRGEFRTYGPWRWRWELDFENELRRHFGLPPLRAPEAPSGERSDV